MHGTLRTERTQDAQRGLILERALAAVDSALELGDQRSDQLRDLFAGDEVALEKLNSRHHDIMEKKGMLQLLRPELTYGIRIFISIFLLKHIFHLIFQHRGRLLKD